jgi:NodT family efflux transporter outer membrane factor (OMF) lipoprotein
MMMLLSACPIASRIALPSLVASCLLAGCSISPHDTGLGVQLPADPGAGASLGPTIPATAQVQDFAVGGSTPREWWRTFDCDSLDSLVEATLSSNEDIKAADANLRQAKELAAETRGALGPQVDASYQFQRARTSASLTPPVTDANQLLYSLHTSQLTVSYPLDVFGGLRNKARSASAAAEAQGFRLLAARQTVAANLVNATISRASLDDQISATRATITAERDLLNMLQQRQRLGLVGAGDIAAQEVTLANAEGGLPSLVRAETRQRAVIAVLLGRPVGENLPPLPDMQCLHLPSHLPVALPADIVRQRPDVRAAEAQVRGAAADVGAAVAARLPNFVLSADAGGTAQDFARMFSDGNLFWSLIGGLTAPILHQGALRHQQHAAEAALEAAKAQYRAIVLQAFADISDALTGLHGDAEALDAAERGTRAAEQSFDLAQRELALGEIGTFSLLGAEAARQQARLQLLQAKAARLTDSVALYQANGGPKDTGD